MGKSEGGSVWLDPAMTSPYAFFQFWLQADDRDVVGYLRVFTDLTEAEIGALEQAVSERPGAREAQRTLARAVTALVHGQAEADTVEAAAAALFGRRELTDLDEATLAAALGEAPSARLAAGSEPTYADLLVATGLVGSTSQARAAVAGGGAYVNNAKITDALGTPDADVWLHGRYLVLRRGRQHVAGVVRER